MCGRDGEMGYQSVSNVIIRRRTEGGRSGARSGRPRRCWRGVLSAYRPSSPPWESNSGRLPLLPASEPTGGGGLIRSIHNLASCVFLSNSVKPELITTVKQAVVGTESEKTSRPTVFSQLRRNDRDVTIFKANSHQGCKKKLQLKCN